MAEKRVDMEFYQHPRVYTAKEQNAIVKYIIDKNKYLELRGNSFWQVMENDKIINRTWQSAKEHFKKKIIYALDEFDISTEHKRRIKAGWAVTERFKKNTNGSTVKKNNNTCDKSSEKSNNGDSLTDSHRKRKLETNETLNTINNTKAKRPKNPLRCKLFSDEEELNKDDDSTHINFSDSVQGNSTEIPSCSKTRSPDIIIVQNTKNINRIEKKTSNESPINDYKNSGNSTETPSCSKTRSPDIIIVQNTKNINRIEKKTSNESPINDYKNSGNSTEIPSCSKTRSPEIITVQNTKNINRIKKETSNESPGNNKNSGYSTEIPSCSKTRSPDKITVQNTKNINRLKKETSNASPTNIKNSEQQPQLMKRFSNDNLPNMFKNIEDKNAHLLKMYKDAGVHIPDNSKALLPKSLETNINYMYCRIMLNGQYHIFFSGLSKNSNQEKVINCLSKEFKIERKYIHATNFVSLYVLEQINKFRHSVLKNVLIQNCNDINLEKVVCGLKVCIQAFDAGDVIIEPRSRLGRKDSAQNPETIQEKNLNPSPDEIIHIEDDSSSTSFYTASSSNQDET